jgi:K+-sensing histidine kinase KdpD
MRSTGEMSAQQCAARSVVSCCMNNTRSAMNVVRALDRQVQVILRTDHNAVEQPHKWYNYEKFSSHTHILHCTTLSWQQKRHLNTLSTTAFFLLEIFFVVLFLLPMVAATASLVREGAVMCCYGLLCCCCYPASVSEMQMACHCSFYRCA